MVSLVKQGAKEKIPKNPLAYKKAGLNEVPAAGF